MSTGDSDTEFQGNKKEKFPPTLAKWFDTQYSKYDAKICWTTPHPPGQSPPSDDTDLLEWKKTKHTEFMNLFPEELSKIADWKKVNFFVNSWDPKIAHYADCRGLIANGSIEPANSRIKH